jgi:hypothetical protein
MRPFTSLQPVRDEHQRACLSAAFRQRGRELAHALLRAAQGADGVDQPFDTLPEWAQALPLTAVDLLRHWFATRSPLFLDLFVGRVHARDGIYMSDAAPEEYRPDWAVQRARAAWVELLRPSCPAAALAVLERDLDDAVAVLAKPALKRLNVLFIGDCLQWEVAATLQSCCARAQLSVRPAHLHDKVSPVLRNRIRTFDQGPFDLIFFSPFSHGSCRSTKPC